MEIYPTGADLSTMADFAAPTYLSSPACILLTLTHATIS